MLITSFGCALLLVGGSALDAPDAGALAASLRAEWDAAKQSGVVTAITPTTTDATECELAVACCRVYAFSNIARAFVSK